MYLRKGSVIEFKVGELICLQTGKTNPCIRSGKFLRYDKKRKNALVSTVVNKYCDGFWYGGKYPENKSNKRIIYKVLICDIIRKEG